MNKITSIIGLVLISAAGIIAALSTNYEDVIKAKKELSSKYINKAQVELDNKNYGKAENFAKLAIKADPNNKDAFELIKNITKASLPIATTQESKKEEAPKPKKKISIDLGC